MAKLLKTIPRVLVELPAGLKSCRDKLQGILHYTRLNGPWELKVVLEGDPYSARPESFKNWKPDGRIIGSPHGTLIGGKVDSKTPTVTLDVPHLLAKHVSRVNHDSEKIAESIAGYYLQQQFAHFAYVGCETGPYWSLIRAQAFERAVQKSGYACSLYAPTVRGKKSDWGQESRNMQAWLLSLPKPCGIMVALDGRARQVLECCVRSGIQVPNEIAIIGVDNDESICENTTPTLSSVLPDFEGGGYMAAELLDQLMRRTQHKPVTLTYGVKRLVHRQSSLHTSRPNWIALKAKEFIRLNACMAISVDDVAKHLNISRRLAELRFREACGYTILTEIQNQRLERVCSLLKETHLPIGQIGERCGFPTEPHLKVLFKKRFGKTMREYRAT
jgi:LacI family transcriptional regulator